MSSGRRDGAIKRLRRTLVGGPRAPSTAQSKSAFADLDHFYEWPNPRYSEVRLARSPVPFGAVLGMQRQVARSEA